MSVIGERQVTGGNGRNPSGQEGWLSSGFHPDDYENALRDSHNRLLGMEGFWPGDKFRIRAATI